MNKVDKEEDCYRRINSVALAAGDASAIGVTGKLVYHASGSRSTLLMEPSNDEARPDFYAIRQAPTLFNVQINDRGSLLIDLIELGTVANVRNTESAVLI